MYDRMTTQRYLPWIFYHYNAIFHYKVHCWRSYFDAKVSTILLQRQSVDGSVLTPQIWLLLDNATVLITLLQRRSVDHSVTTPKSLLLFCNTIYYRPLHNNIKVLTAVLQRRSAEDSITTLKCWRRYYNALLLPNVVDCTVCIFYTFYAHHTRCAFCKLFRV